MKFYSPKQLYLGAFALICAVWATSLDARADEQEMKTIAERATPIVPMLDDAPNYGAKVAEREFWDKLAKLGSAQNTIKAAEAALKESNPDLPEDLYKEYYKNGNRTHYQSAYGRLTSRIDRFALAEMFENKGRFVKPLEEAIDYLCAQPSWVLPAHDSNAGVYDGKTMISDLGSTLAGGNLAIVVNMLEDKLSPEIVAKAKAEIERRILVPYEKAVEGKLNMWWVRTTNNWSAVCHAGTIAAALNVVDSKERRAWFVAAADYFSEKYFMQGFTNDGYCSEGMGYWNYGVGNYMLLGAFARNATHGQVDFFRFPKMHAVLDYAPTLEIDKGNYAVFADCAMTARPSATYVGYLSRLKNYGYTEFESQGLGDRFGVGDPMQLTAFGFDREVTFPDVAPEPKKYEPPIRTEFPDAGVLICRPAADAQGKYFAVAFKGGHNNEMHNHNDVGSYTLILGSNDPNAKKKDVFVSRDPGGETYTARTFSGRRYEGQLLNSFGHPVPLVDGKLQSTGGKARGVVLEKELTDELDKVTIDFASAYATPKLQALSRSFEYKRATGSDSGYFKIADSVAFKDGEKGTFESAIVTFEKANVKENGQGLTIEIDEAVVDVVATDAAGAPLKLVAESKIVGENDDSVPNKPTRLALRVDGEVQNATVVQTFTAK